MFRALILIVSLVISVFASPINLYNLEELDDENYDIVIDQRQNGTQNFRIRISGLNIALPAEEEEPPSSQSQLSGGDLSSLLFSGLSPSTSSQHSSSSVTNDKNEFAELASLFDWKKKANKKSSDTQSRTKDLPTESQVNNDAKMAIRNYVKGNGRKYKLLVGEKYIIPLIQYLKQQAESSD